MNFIDIFTKTLAAYPEREDLGNPYRQAHCKDNLQAYLRAQFAQPGRRILVVGEALGYRGGWHTGIPFSSARLVMESEHPFWRKLRPQLTVDCDVSEATASITWDYLKQRRRIPLFWNALPLHPRVAGDPLSNRAPNAAELQAGLSFLQALGDAYQPDLIAGVGGKGTMAAEKAFPRRRVHALRHPSYGGKAQFCQGMDRLLGS